MANSNPIPTKRQQQTVRDKMTKAASGIADRFIKNANGELKNPQGEPIEMTMGQIKSGEIILARCVSTLTSSQIEDVTPRKSGEEIKEETRQLFLAAGLDEEQAEQALMRIAQKAIH